MPELSICIPARNEEWLNLTVADILANSTADTDVIVVLDGVWPDLPLDQHPKVTVVKLPVSIGQRAATNLAARISTAPYLMKLDAHCAFPPGFDTVLLQSAKELGPNVIQIPAQKNLHVWDWVCKGCGRREYQCGLTECRVCYSKELEKDVVWKPRRGTTTTRWRFDETLHFQYWGGAKGEYIETMSCLGACWFVSREYWDAIDGLDEGHGSWGNVGTEIGCKAWLSGGRLVTNTRTWYAHLFRVGGQKFPYEITGAEQEAARVYSRNLWRNNAWAKQVYPLKWLVDKFWPVPGWTEEQRDALPGGLRDREPVGLLDGGTTGDTPAGVDGSGHSGALRGDSPRATGAVGGADAGSGASPVSPVRGQLPRAHVAIARPPSKGIVYYSDSLVRPDIARAALDTIQASGLPVVAVTLPKPGTVGTLIEGAQNIIMPLERGYLTMFKQILAGLERLETDVAFLCEHDVLYHSSHFAFVPPDATRVFYNRNVWKVDATTGKTLHYLCSQTSGLCAHRELLVEHYRRRVALVEARGFSRKMGFEPGTHRRAERVDDLVAAAWMAEYPNVDIRHDTNLTPSRWRQDQFRDRRNCQGWTEGTGVPGWGETFGRFNDFVRDVSAAQQAVA